MNRLLKTKKFLLSFLGISSLPFKEGKLDLQEDQEQKVIDALGEKDFKTMVKAINKEANDVLQSKENKQLIADARAEFLASLKESGYTEEEIKEIAQEEGATAEDGKDGKDGKDKTPEADASLEGLIKDFKSYQKKTDAMISKLISDPEPDAVHHLTPNQDMNGVEHSATHLFGEAKAYNEFAGRPWNERAAGMRKEATVWDGTAGEVNIQKLNGDVELFYRENPRTVESLHRDFIELPSFWPRRLNVSDRISDGRIMSDEITQARKLPWLPKNKQKIQPEVRQIFDVSIDLQWTGYHLQQIEKNWLNTLYNREGSSPYKMTFVQFLVSELMKKAKNEDRISAVKGIYVATPEDATVAGKAINRQDGLLYQLFKAMYVTNKIKYPSIGEATPENIVDYVRKNIEVNLDEEIRENQNLVYYLEPEHMRLYIDRKEMLKGVFNTTTSKAEYQTVDHYPNIRLEPLHDLAGTGVHFITFADNIEVLEDIPNEKGMLRFEMLKRMIYGHGDYKFGCGFVHMGTEVADGDPDAFKVQSVWTNGVFPFKQDFYIPFHDDGSGKLKVKYSNLQVSAGFETDIATLSTEGLFKGQIIRLKGNTSGVTANLKDNDTFDIASDFDLSTGGTITLVVQNDFTLKEVKRTTAPANNAAEVYEFGGDAIDMTNGTTQAFNGTATTLAEIENGVPQQKLTILNNGTENLTVSDVSGVISVTANAVIKPGDELVLILIDGVWTEFFRDIAA